MLRADLLPLLKILPPPPLDLCSAFRCAAYAGTSIRWQAFGMSADNRRS